MVFLFFRYKRRPPPLPRGETRGADLDAQGRGVAAGSSTVQQAEVGFCGAGGSSCCVLVCQRINEGEGFRLGTIPAGVFFFILGLHSATCFFTFGNQTHSALLGEIVKWTVFKKKKLHAESFFRCGFGSKLHPPMFISKHSYSHAHPPAFPRTLKSPSSSRSRISTLWPPPPPPASGSHGNLSAFQ